MIRHLALSLGLSGLLALSALASTPEALKIDLPVQKFTLKNGLTVLLLEDRRIPMVSYHTWYKVGSRDEREGITGAAHMLEHMMFQGGKKYSGKDFHRIMDENGISWNAFTTYDYTGFYMNLPSSRLELIMDLEVDRMSALALNEQNLLTERDVVKEERRSRVDNNPPGQLWELTMSTFFKTSPYRWPIIGWMRDIAKYDIATMRKFYEQYYGPNNAVLVIAGDIRSSQVKKMVEKYYGGLTPRPVPERAAGAEPRRQGQAQARLEKTVQSASFNLAYPGVKEGDPDMYVLDLAGAILGAGTSSRMHRQLVYQRQVALSASAGHYALQDTGVFFVSATLKPGQSVETARALAAQEMLRLRTTKVSEEELKKAKTIQMKGLVDGMRTMDSKARILAAAEIVTGSYQSVFDNLEKYNQVTVDDIQRVAQKYLIPSGSAFAALVPQGTTSTPAPTSAPAQGGNQ